MLKLQTSVCITGHYTSYETMIGYDSISNAANSAAMAIGECWKPCSTVLQGDKYRIHLHII